MDLVRLKYFCNVGKTGSIRGSAKELQMTAGALSRAIKQLEAELQIPLLVQDGRNIKISDEGKILIQKSESIMREVEELRELVRTRATETKPLRLGSFETFSTYFLRHLLGGESSRWPIQLQDLAPGTLELALLDGRIDLGLTYSPVPFADLNHFKIGPIASGIYVRKGAFTGYSFANLPFVVPSKPIFGIPTLNQGLDGWPDDQMVRNAIYQVSLMESAIEICEMGLAAAYLPRFAVRIHNERVVDELRLREFPVPKGVEITSPLIYGVKRKSYVDNEMSLQVVRVVRGLTREAKA